MDEVADLLRERRSTVAVAESCTGGRLAAAFTEAPGSSEYFLGGVVAYANEVKMNVLGVEGETLEKHGAVSREVAIEMARGIQRITGADFTLATTGIAGPGGGSPEKPVGTVWVATATAIKDTDGKVTIEITAQKFHFTGTRTEIMAAATRTAIEILKASISLSSRSTPRLR